MSYAPPTVKSHFPTISSRELIHSKWPSNAETEGTLPGGTFCAHMSENRDNAWMLRVSKHRVILTTAIIQSIVLCMILVVARPDFVLKKRSDMELPCTCYTNVLAISAITTLCTICVTQYGRSSV